MRLSTCSPSGAGSSTRILKGAAAEGPAPALLIAPCQSDTDLSCWSHYPASEPSEKPQGSSSSAIYPQLRPGSRLSGVMLPFPGRKEAALSPWPCRQTDSVADRPGRGSLRRENHCHDQCPAPSPAVPPPGWLARAAHGSKMLSQWGWHSPTPISVLCPPPPAPKQGGTQLGMAPLAHWQPLQRCHELPAAVTGRCGAHRTSAPRRQSLPTPLLAGSCLDSRAQLSPDPPPGSRRQRLCPFRVEQMGSSKVLQGERFIFTVHHHLGICMERREHEDSRHPPGCRSHRLH